MPDIRSDNCGFHKKLAEYKDGFIIFKCNNSLKPQCLGCVRLKKIKLSELMSSSSEIAI